ncbi:MAG: hypothetical protein DRJ10_02480, partial [Bacteroidetes bacterium]
MTLVTKEYNIIVKALGFFTLFVIFSHFFCCEAIASDYNFENALKKANTFDNINSDSTLYYAKIAFNEAKKERDKQLELKALIFLAKANLKAGKQADAIINCAAAIDIVKNNNIALAEVLMYYGVAYQAAGYSSESINYLLEAQDEIVKNQNFDLAIDLDYYTALAYIEIKKYDIGIKYLNNSIRKSIDHEYPVGAFKSYILLSNLFQRADSIQKYLALAESVIEEAPELAYEKAALRNNQALVNKAIGEFELAHKQYSDAINIARSNRFDTYLANFNNNFAYLLMAEHKYDSAGIVLAEALQIAKEIGNLDLQASVYDSYADYFAAVGRHDLAFVYQDSSFV